MSYVTPTLDSIYAVNQLTLNDPEKYNFQKSSPKRLLVPIEPTEGEIKEYPWLRGLGGIAEHGRHPILIHWCHCFFVMKSTDIMFQQIRKEIQDMIDNHIANLENTTAKQKFVYETKLSRAKEMLSRLLLQRNECQAQLQKLKNGGFEGMTQSDLCYGNKFFTDPENVRVTETNPDV